MARATVAAILALLRAVGTLAALVTAATGIATMASLRTFVMATALAPNLDHLGLGGHLGLGRSGLGCRLSRGVRRSQSRAFGRSHGLSGAGLNLLLGDGCLGSLHGNRTDLLGADRSLGGLGGCGLG